MTDDHKTRLTANFAGARKRFLSISYPADYAKLVKNGQLENHLMQIGSEAADLYQTLENQLKTKANEILVEQERQAYLSQIPFMAKDMVLSEIVDVRP